MFRKQIAIPAILLLIGLVSLVYGSRALADLSMFDPAASALETKLILKPDLAISKDQQVQLMAARPVIARRLDQLKLQGPYRVVIRDGQLEVTLPKDKNTPYVTAMITSVGEITFIDGGTDSPPVGESVQLGIRTNSAGHVYHILFTSREVQEIAPPDTTNGEVFYRLKLQPAAADRFAEFNRNGSNSYVCMVLDEQVINCSLLYHQNGDTLEILPELGSDAGINMDDLAVFLYSGPLSTRLRIVAD